MKTKIKFTLAFYVVLAVMTILSACVPADMASQNISTAADNFEIFRRIVFYDSINGEVIFEIFGFCSLGNYDAAGEVTVTCKDENGEYSKHFLGLSDNVTYMAIQLDPAEIGDRRFRIIIRPDALIPDFDLDLP